MKSTLLSVHDMTTMLRCAKLYEPAKRTSSILTRTGATSSSAKCPHSVLHLLKFSSPSSRSVFLESGLYSSRSFVRYFGKQPWRVQNRRGNWGSDSPLFDGNNVLYAIMGLNVITTGAWYLSERNYQYKKFMRENFMVSSNGVLRHFRVHTLVTAIFTNYDISHLISNLFSIYIAFTPGGGARFAAMYLAGGLLSTGTQVMMVNREYESISGDTNGIVRKDRIFLSE